MHSYSLLLLTAATALATRAEPPASPFYSKETQAEIRKSWPTAVPFPAGIRFYRPTEYCQYVVIRSGLDHREWFPTDRDYQYSNGIGTNPNAVAPWRVPGGLEDVTGWRSYIGAKVPQLETWVERVEAGARRRLPMRRWKFAEGSIFVDLLVNADGKPFELRQRSNKGGEWRAQKVWQDLGAAPRGYRGHGVTGKTCVDCHSKPGTQEGYGLRFRGDDGCFSWPFVELTGGEP